MDLLNDSVSSSRGVRGGVWDYDSFLFSSSDRFFVDPDFEGEGIGIGFRVASPGNEAGSATCLGQTR